MNGSVEDGILQRAPKISKPRIEAVGDSQRKLQKQEHLQHLRTLSLSGILVVLVNLVYFVYRIIVSFSDKSDSSPSEVLIMWIFLGLELGLAGPSIMLSIVTILEYTKLKIRPSLRLIGNQVPTVDVLIPCCGESLDTILNTVRAACALDYPEKKFRVVILDDGNSTDLKEKIDELRKTKENLFYAIRGVKVVGHSKAANLNHGLRFVDMRGSSEYIAVLDVDMIPMTNFLRALIPHLVDKPEFAMAASPQSFYNIPDGDPLGQSLHIGFDILLFLGESKNGTLCPGSGFVVRRSAIDDIGGFPTDHPMEDVMTSLLFWQKRWKIAYVWERLQWGTVPETYAGHTLQATKWTQGVVSITATSLLGSRLPLLTRNHCFRIILIFIGFLGPVVFLGFTMVFNPLVLLSKKLSSWQTRMSSNVY